MARKAKPPAPRRRKSLTKLQRASAVGAELIELCETITEDGHLDDGEIAALRQWLSDNEDADLPAREHLVATVRHILSDRKVTAEERRTLYQAIETILPPDIRESVRGRRLSAEKAARETAPPATGEEPAPPPGAVGAPESWEFMVAGVHLGERPEVIDRFAEPGSVAFLVRDRGHGSSPHAIEVRLANGMGVGFVPEEHAVDMAALLDSGYLHVASLKDVLVGGRTPIPVVIAELYPAGSDTPGAVSEEQVPAAQPLSAAAEAPGPEKTGAGCLPALAIWLVFAAVAWAARAL
jgi:hypothetical protein